MSTTETENLAFAKRYLAALERGAVGDELAAFYTSDVIQEELPNRLLPNGARRDLAALLEGAVRGQKAMTSQRFELLEAVTSGDRLALEVRWTGTLAIALGTLPAGGQMVCRYAMFLEMRDGKIARQRNYDCFDPF
jgi:ketosteroid isomerase-like protein